MEPKTSYWKFVIVFMAIVVVAAGGYFIWSTFFKYDINKVYKEQEAKYVAAMTADTYGGKTPQETLDLFVAALRKGDVELASKYFLLDENASRERWVVALSESKKQGLLITIIAKLEKAIPDPKDSISDSDYKYVLLDKNGLAEATMRLRFNKYSSIWKIESL